MLRRRSRDRVAVVHDHRLGELAFPATDTVIAPFVRANGTWELREGLWFDAVLRPGMTVVNVGANVGYFALWAGDRVGPTGRVVAVEPDPENFNLLRRNVAARGWDNVELVRAAAGRESGTIMLHRSRDNCGDHRVMAHADSDESIAVRQVVLDDLLAADHVDVVMTDTQGWDHHVLAGMADTIRRDRPAILTEFVPAWLRDAGESPEAVLEQYNGRGYRIGVLDAGIAPGEWDAAQIVAWLDEPGRLFATLELWPEQRPLPVRVSASAQFWPPEHRADGSASWLVLPEGSLAITGPAHAEGRLSADIIPAPGSELDLTVTQPDGTTREIRSAAPVRLDVAARLDASGVARVGLRDRHEKPPRNADPRPLRICVQSPRFTLTG